MNLIKQQQLSNNMTLSFYDCSRPIAADRWFVKLRCELTINLPDSAWLECEEEEAGLLAEIRQQLGQSLTLALTRERNFIDAGDREKIVAECVGKVEENLGAYLSDPSFPVKLFARQYEEARQRCRMARHSTVPVDGDDDDGPADFSACFRD
ncbi:MAG: hypothetical protein OEV91_02280 [Desulfobulbaceae bacterium]|nr:hypothetical protein [Desulfobulbaceae bacterium]